VSVTMASAAPTAAVPPEVIVPGPREQNPARWHRRRRRLNRALTWVFPVLVIVVWHMASTAGWIDDRIFSNPADVARSAWDLAKSGVLWDNVAATLRRVVLGYVLGASIGVLLGLVVGTSDIGRAISKPSLTALYSVPKLGIFPLLLIWFGIGETSKIVLAALSVFLIVSLATIEAVSQVPTSYLEAARSLRAGRTATFFEVVIPASLAKIFTSLRLGIGYAILVVIGTEMVSANDGLGYMLWSGWNLFRTEQMFVGIIISAALGAVGAFLISGLERLVMPWRRAGGRMVV